MVYRLSVGAMSMSAGCFEDGEIPIDVKNDNSDVGAPLTVILHVGPDETYFLDMGETSYAGSAIEGGYRFTGQTIDVNLETGGDMMMDTKKEESEVVTTIEFMVDGSSAQGTITMQETYRCTGDACPELSQRTCNKSGSFVGSEVEDVELEHTI